MSSVSLTPDSQAPGQQLGDYLRALRRRWRLIALITALVTVAALAVSLTSERQYDATAKLLLNRAEAINSLIDPTAQGGSDDPERDINTDVELIKLDTIAEAVKARLGLDISNTELLDQVSTEVAATSDVVSLTVRDRDPRRAAAIANQFAREYVSFRRRSARANINEAVTLAQSQLNSLTQAERDSDQGRRLQERLRDLQLAAALQTGGVEIVRQASIPSDASRPRPVLAFVLGVLLGLLLATIVALVLELADRRIKAEDDAEDIFDAPLVASVPRPARRSTGPPGDDRGQREAYGTLAANLRFSTTSSEASVLMVTSPAPQEGKTNVTLGMARALAMLGQRVIAIEADLRRPAFARYAQLEGDEGGLGAVLAGTSRLSDELVWLDATDFRPVTLSGLQDGSSVALLPAGQPVANPQRALSRPAMGELLDEARALADIVVVDTAPIGTVNDAAALARHTDAVVVVARLNRTTRDAAQRTRRLLENLGAPLAGLVITDGAGIGDGYYGGHAPDGVPAGAGPRVSAS